MNSNAAESSVTWLDTLTRVSMPKGLKKKVDVDVVVVAVVVVAAAAAAAVAAA